METDDMYQNAGEKGLLHLDVADPPRRHTNNKRGHGIFETDRPPVAGVIGRDSGKVALQVTHTASTAELRTVVERATQPTATVNTDEWRAYNWLALTQHSHVTVTHNPAQREWARDEDGNRVREVHTNQHHRRLLDRLT